MWYLPTQRREKATGENPKEKPINQKIQKE
jgi:hypothetical protein